MTARPRLTPAMADTRRAVRELLRGVFPEALEAMTKMPGCAGGTGYDVPADAPLVLVGLSGGPDSLALAAAAAFEAQRSGIRAGAVIVDHGLQQGSAEVAARAADQARKLGLTPVEVRRSSSAERVSRPPRCESKGPEADARAARYEAFESAITQSGAAAILLAHTLDDQAETVLLGLTRGAGAASIAGMQPITGKFLRPFLGIRREQTVAACADQGLEPWHDPHNLDSSYTRVRIRREVLPVLEQQIGPGVAEALARTAEHLRADAEVLDTLADELFLATLAETGSHFATVSLLDRRLENSPQATRVRVYQRAAALAGLGALTSTHIRAVDELVSKWHGQAPIDAPNGQVARENGILRFTSARASA